MYVHIGTIIRSFLHVLLCFLAVSASVRAQTSVSRSLDTGMDLYEWCTDREHGVCLAYLQGLAEGFGWGGAYSTGGKPLSSDVVSHLICFPKTTTPAQARLIFIKWAEANPGRLSERASIVAIAAFTSAFPCR